MSEMITRFSKRQRIEHLAMMVVFIVLCVTGLPQKYYQADMSVAVSAHSAASASCDGCTAPPDYCSS